MDQPPLMELNLAANAISLHLNTNTLTTIKCADGFEQEQHAQAWA